MTYAQALSGRLAGKARRILGGGGDLDVVVRSAGLVMGIRVIGAGMVYLMNILLSRWLGVHEYGAFVYAFMVVMVVGSLISLGLNDAMLRFIPDYLERGKHRRLRGVIHYARWIVLLAAGALMLVAAVVVHWAGDWIAEAYRTPLLIAFAVIPAFAIADVFEAMNRGFGWVSRAYVPIYWIRPGLISLLVGLAWHLGAPVTATFAMLLVLGAFWATLAGQFIDFERRVRTVVPPVGRVNFSGYWLRAALPFLMLTGFTMLWENMGVFMLGVLARPEDVSTYFAALRTSAFAVYIIFAISARSAPKFSELYTRGEIGQLRDLYLSVVRWTFFPTVGVALALMLCGKFLLGLFGEAFGGAYAILGILLAGIVIQALAGPLIYLLNMTEEQRATAWVMMGTVVFNIALNLMLIPLWSGYGAAFAMLFSVLLNVALLSWLTWRKFAISPAALIGAALNRSGAARHS